AIGRVGHRGDVERVAVGIGSRRDLSADIGAGAATVLDHHLLTPSLREPVAKDACDHVGGAAGHERNDDADVPRGPALQRRTLCSGRTGERAGRQHGRGKKPGETAAGEHEPPPPSRPLAGAKPRAHPRVSICSGEATAERPVGQPATGPRYVAPQGLLRASFAYFPFPAAIGGRSASLLTVFLPTCSPPLSRNIARATAISAPRMAPSVPFRALLSLIVNSDHSHLGQRPCRIEVPEGDARERDCGSLVAHGRSV